MRQGFKLAKALACGFRYPKLHVRALAVSALFFVGLIPSLQETSAGEPVSEVWGRVFDASTRRPISGVEVQQRSTALSSDGLPVCVGLAVTDSTGLYRFGACEEAIIRYTAIGYETLVLRFPDDVTCSDADYCCGRLRDIELTASRRWLH